MKKYILLRVSANQLEDVRSAVSFTIREFERVAKQKAPNFLRGLKGVNKKLWTKAIVKQSREAGL